MSDGDKSRLREQGICIRHLWEEQQLLAEAFADRLDIKPGQLRPIEEGLREATSKIIRQLPDISNAYDHDMRNFFGDRWERLKELEADAL